MQTEPKEEDTVRIILGCVLGLITVLGALSWMNAADIIKVSVDVDSVKSSVEMIKCNNPNNKPECRADF